jgi:hypothetical protein
MTEAEWLSCTSAGKMLHYLCEQCGAARRKDGRRKLRLLACACCRRIWHKLTEDGRQIVLLNELLADGQAVTEDLDAAVLRCLAGSMNKYGWIPPAIRAAVATNVPPPREAAESAMFGACSAVASHGPGYSERWNAEAAAQAEFMREIFGNPFQPIKVEKRWRTANDGAVVRLAQSICQEGSFADMPILADALEEAGCREEAILSHCWGTAGHVLGCWVLDVLLARS